jgi:hypothetical protein
LLARIALWLAHGINLIDVSFIVSDDVADGPTLTEVIKNGGTMVLTNTRKKNVTARFTDADGKDARVDGIPIWRSSDESVATLDVAADGMSAKVLPAQPGVTVGSSTIVVVADADLGSGVEQVEGSLQVDVRAPKATAVSLEEGEEEPL